MLHPTTEFGALDAQRNIRWYAVFRITYEFGLWFPIWILFLTRELGLTFTEIMVLEAAFQALIVVFEVPMGIFADRYGRRPAFMISVLSMAVSLTLFGLATGFWWIFASFVVWALALSSLNGTDGAFIYESLLGAGREHEFSRVLGRLTTATMVGTVVAMGIGGWMATFGYRVPVLIHVALMPIAFFAATRMREPPRAEGVNPGTVREMFDAIRKLLRRGIRFRALLAMSAAIHSTFLIVVLYKQPLLIENGIPLALLGWVFAGGALITSVSPMVLTSLRQRLGTWKVLQLAAMVISLACVGVYYTAGPWVLIPIIIAEFAIGGVRPVVVDGLNQQAGPQGRATVLSLRGIVDAGVAGPMEVMSGWFADRVPLRQLFAACALGLPVMIVLLGRVWKRGE
jgi:MFS family permease